MPKHRFPKQIVGVKLPKRLRTGAERLLKLADHPLVNETIAAALIAGAAALLDQKGKRGVVRAAGLGGAAAAVKAANGANRIGLALAIALAEAAASLATAPKQKAEKS